MASLLAMAQTVQLKRRGSRLVTKEEMELALAWSKGLVSITQVAGALGSKTGGVYPFLANALRQYLEQERHEV
jgi:hypothetical protein